MGTIATVRVANRADPDNYVTINASDYRELVHGPLWPEQAPDFEGLPTPPVSSYSSEERSFAAALLLDIVAFRRQTSGQSDFSSLSSQERMTLLRDHRSEFEQGRRDYLEHQQRSSQVSEAQARAETQGGGEQLPKEPRDGGGDQPQGGGDPTPVGGASGGTGGTDGGTGGESPTGGGGAPSWAAKKAGEPATEEARTEVGPTVEKGPGGKYYVKRGTEVVSQGFTTKREAEEHAATLT